jgi:hypothetical protein
MAGQPRAQETVTVLAVPILFSSGYASGLSHTKRLILDNGVSLLTEPSCHRCSAIRLRFRRSPTSGLLYSATGFLFLTQSRRAGIYQPVLISANSLNPSPSDLETPGP